MPTPAVSSPAVAADTSVIATAPGIPSANSKPITPSLTASPGKPHLTLTGSSLLEPKPLPQPQINKGSLFQVKRFRGTPLWLNVWGLGAITAGAFTTTYYSSKVAARQCIQCFIDLEDKKSALYKATRELLEQNHKDASVYFKNEKHLPKTA